MIDMQELAEKNIIATPELESVDPEKLEEFSADQYSLGIETNVKEFARKEQAKLKKRIELSQLYRMISLDFLTMKDSQGYPAFAVFGIHSATCKLSGQYEQRRSSSKPSETSGGNISKPFSNYMESTYQSLIKKAKRNLSLWGTGMFRGLGESEVYITQEFMSVVPGSTKEKIKEAEQYFRGTGSGSSGHLVIVSESAGWKENEVVKELPKNPDPLVIGWNEVADAAYLIDSFDLTNMEKMIQSEFTMD